MALLFMEGFEVDGGNATALSRKYDAATSVSSTITGRLHGTAMSMTGTGRLRTRSLTSPTGTVVLGFGFRDRTSGAAANGFEINILNGVSEQLTLAFVQVTTSTFRIDVKRGSTTLASTAAFATGTWHHFELKAVIATGTGGSFELRRNETSVASGTGVNTADSGAANWDAVDINGNSTAGTVALDDIHILDGTGSTNNDFLGDCVIEGRLPNADGATVDWTPSSGVNHFDLLDDATDATNVTSGTPGDIDLLSFPSLSFITGTIFGVMPTMYVNLDALGSRNVRHKVDSNGTVLNGDSQSVNGTTYVGLSQIVETDPDTALAWTPSGVNAALFGFELVS